MRRNTIPDYRHSEMKEARWRGLGARGEAKTSGKSGSWKRCLEFRWVPGTRLAHAPLAVLRVQAEGSGRVFCFKDNLGWIPLQQRAAPLDADNKNIVLVRVG